ncbi:MAG: DUF937 domain-containing protein [Lachnospiraceae bacterium]|nr:DUF937 domain-containing protein [Lachnospiraceae bacterium]
MDVGSILGKIFNSEQLAGITKAAGVSEGETTNVLSSALNLVAGQTTQRGFNLGSLASLAGGDAGNIITSLLGAGGAQTVAQQSGVSQNATNSILSAAAPGLLSALTGEGGGNILSMLGGLVGGSGAAESAGDIIQTVVSGAGSAAGNAKEETAQAKEQGESKFWSFVASLFGKNK